MKRFPIAFVLVIAVASAAAQLTSGPGVCFAFNPYIPGPSSYLPLVAGGELYFGFTTPVTASVERIDLVTTFPVTSQVISVQVFQATGTTLGTFLGSGSAIPQTAHLALTAPVAFTAGSTYAVRLTISSSFLVIIGNSVPSTPIQYVLNCGATPPALFPPCSSHPVTGTFGACLSFRSNACGQTPYAVATQIGTGCGAAANLSVNAPPVLGSALQFLASGFFQSGSCQVFFAAGPATAGVSLPFGPGCNAYLDLVSLQALASAGLEPLSSFPIQGTFSGAFVNIPLNPALAGVTLTTQALLLLSTPSIPTAYGNLALSNAIELTLGY
jgi:hypothetical protein